MSDKKFTDEEIIKAALEGEIHLAEYVDSDYCCNTEVSLLKSTLDLINRQKAENLELRLKVNELLAYKQEVIKNHIKNYETYKSQKAEIEQCQPSRAQIGADRIKRMLEEGVIIT